MRKIERYAYLAILEVAQQCLKNASDNVPIPRNVNDSIINNTISCMK